MSTSKTTTGRGPGRPPASAYPSTPGDGNLTPLYINQFVEAQSGMGVTATGTVHLQMDPQTWKLMRARLENANTKPCRLIFANSISVGTPKTKAAGAGG